MSLWKTAGLCIGALSAGIAVAAAVATGQPSQLGALANNEGILVNIKTFNIVKGTAKGEPSALLVKSGAKQVAEGAVIFRTGDKLYIIDGDPAGRPQGMNPSDPMPTTIDGFNSLFENF